MKTTLTLVIPFVILIAISCASFRDDQLITFESLLQEMTDRERLPLYPEPLYITRQFSSYDRASVAPDQPGWFSNWDRSMFIREEDNQGRLEYVMMEAEGPGAIVRFWMTFAGQGAGEGILRIYFDYGTEPAIEGSAYDILSRGQLTEGPLARSVPPGAVFERRGHNLYMPLPYAKHVKVTYESENITEPGAKTGGENVYYIINYRDYDKGVSVETLTREILESASSTLQRINEKLENRDFDSYLGKINTSHVTLTGIIQPGGTMEQQISGTRAIREILLQLDADDMEQALRSTVMEIEFDGNRTVWCPAGDFFGTGYQIRNVNTWYTNVSEEGLMRSLWIMPFQGEATVRFHNFGNQPVNINKCRLTSSAWRWDRRSMHFGATWHQYTDLYTGEGKTMSGDGNPFDLNYTHLKGKGVVVGDVLTLFNTAWWWGEGDEKIYIDGEDFPSHFGTGTEDYYGYAWSRPEPFNEPFIAQPDGSGNLSPGYTVNIRYRSLDAIPFTSELRFDMEMLHWESTRINFAPATFFYLKPGGEILPGTDVAGAREKVILERLEIISPWIENGVIEGENLIIVEESGNLRWQWSDQWGLSGNQKLWWRRADPGDILHLGFKSAEAGKKNAFVNLTTARNYGLVEITINDSAPVKFNGWDPEGVKVKKIELGEILLREGLNNFKIRMLLPGPDQEQGMIGIDVLSFN
jgi:hypothetical protein